MKFVNILKSDMQSGIFIIAENIFSIDRILFRLPEYLSDIRRRKAIIVITNTTDPEFDGLTVDILTKFWKQAKLANVILITPCKNDPEVRSKPIFSFSLRKFMHKIFHCYRLFAVIFHFNRFKPEIPLAGAFANSFQ